MTKTINTAEYKIFTWDNSNPMPPCGKFCPFYSTWEEEER